MKTFGLKRFSWLSTTRTLSADASELDIAPGVVALSFDVLSPTGHIERFTFKTVHRDAEGEIVSWEYTSTSLDVPITAIIYND